MIRALGGCVVLLFAACAPKPSCGSGPERLAFRDGNGALRARLAASSKPHELDLCDAAGQRLGSITSEGDTLRLYDRAHAERLRSERADATELIGPAGPALRLYRAENTLRILHMDGVPAGSLSERGAMVYVSDPGGSPVSTAARRDGDAVLAAPDGAVQAYLVPSPGLPAAAVFAIEGLALEERFLLALHLSRGSLIP